MMIRGGSIMQRLPSFVCPMLVLAALLAGAGDRSGGAGYAL